MGRVHTTVLGDARDPVPAVDDHEPDQPAAAAADTHNPDPEAPAPRTKKRSTT